MHLQVVSDRDRRLVVDEKIKSSSGSGSLNRRALAIQSRWIASLLASEAAMISASHEESATETCFFEPQDISALGLNMKTHPEVECFTPQSESDIP